MTEMIETVAASPPENRLSLKAWTRVEKRTILVAVFLFVDIFPGAGSHPVRHAGHAG